MNHRKFKADHIFTGYELFGPEHVLIAKDDGEIVGIEKQIDAGENIETFSGIITPGFINAHCHLELSHMKGLIPEKTGLVDFVFKVVTERHFPDEEIAEAIVKAEEQMLQSGIVAVGDICNNLSTFDQKLKRNLAYYNFIEASGWLPSVSKTRFEKVLNLYSNFSNQTTSNEQRTSANEQRITNNEQRTSAKDQRTSANEQRTSANDQRTTIVPHAPYSVSENLWKGITPYFENKVVSIHNQETAFEDEFFLHGTGDFIRMYQKMNIDNSFYVPSNKSSLQTYFSKFSKAKNVILVHNTFTKQEDIDFIKIQTTKYQVQTFFCLCVNANQYIENALPPVELLTKNNCSIILGTDSLASNHSLNILDEMETIQKNFPYVLLPQMLQWATLNGAKALQMDNTLGSFEKGKKPGIVLIANCVNHDLLDLKESTIKRIL